MRRFMKAGIPCLFFLLMLSQARAAELSKPNVILIMADDVGEECFGAYGSDTFDTPNVDALAKQGLRFTHAYSQPLCTPTRVEIMSGRSNIRNYTAFGVLPRDVKTFGHMFQAAGYATAVAGKWQLYGSNHYPDKLRHTGTLPGEAGFDQWCLWQVRRATDRYWKPSLNINGEFQKFGKDTYGPDVCANFLVDFIEQHQDEPFFAYYPMILPHGPFRPTPGSEDRGEKNNLKNFKDMVGYVDTLVGRITDKVDALGIEGRTLIIFTGDNGTNRRLVYGYQGGAYRGGKGKTTEAGMHVPLVARMPGRVPKGRVCEDLVGFRDVLPTLAAFTGVARPDQPTDGVSFAPQLRGEQGEPRSWLFSYYWPKPVKRPKQWPEARFAWDKQWQLYSDGRLFHTAEDPRQKHPIRPGQGEKAAKTARAKLKKALQSMPAEPRNIPGR